MKLIAHTKLRFHRRRRIDYEIGAWGFGRLPAAQREAIKAWLRQHDIDPNECERFRISGDQITAMLLAPSDRRNPGPEWPPVVWVTRTLTAPLPGGAA